MPVVPVRTAVSGAAHAAEPAFRVAHLDAVGLKSAAKRPGYSPRRWSVANESVGAPLRSFACMYTSATNGRRRSAAAVRSGVAGSSSMNAVVSWIARSVSLSACVARRPGRSPGHGVSGATSEP